MKTPMASADQQEQTCQCIRTKYRQLENANSDRVPPDLVPPDLVYSRSLQGIEVRCFYYLIVLCVVRVVVVRLFVQSETICNLTLAVVGYPGVVLCSAHSAQVAQQRPSRPSQNYLFFTMLFFINSNRIHVYKNKTNTIENIKC
jgi:hypothetical protein